MTLRRRKRGGPHFALTCDGAPGCHNEFRAERDGVSSYTVRHEAAAAGWTTDTPRFDHSTKDYCPDHPRTGFGFGGGS